VAEARAANQARERATLAAARARAITPQARSGHSTSAVGKALFAVALVLLMLAIAPSRPAYAVSPRAGNVLVRSRLPLAGIGVATAVGLLIAFGLSGSP
jgi:hypothetical protein